MESQDFIVGPDPGHQAIAGSGEERCEASGGPANRKNHLTLISVEEESSFHIFCEFRVVGQVYPDATNIREAEIRR